KAIGAPNPIQVGATPVSRTNLITHPTPMLSLKDIFTFDEFDKWKESLLKKLGVGRTTLTVEWKYDGLALSLIYENGHLKTVATRGDGQVGENVTDKFNLHTRGVWKTIPNHYTGEVRGEGVVDSEWWAEVNEQRTTTGGSPYSSERHLAAACIRGTI